MQKIHLILAEKVMKRNYQATSFAGNNNKRGSFNFQQKTWKLNKSSDKWNQDEINLITEYKKAQKNQKAKEKRDNDKLEKEKLKYRIDHNLDKANAPMRKKERVRVVAQLMKGVNLPKVKDQFGNNIK